MVLFFQICCAVFALTSPLPAFAVGAEAQHNDPLAVVLLMCGLLLIGAMVGRAAARRLGQSAVLGELVAGVIVGNVGVYLGSPFFVAVMHLQGLSEAIVEAIRGGSSASAALSTLLPISGADLPILQTLLSVSDNTPTLVALFALHLLSYLGILVLLFSVGLESTVPQMMRVGVRALLVAVVGVVAPFLLGTAVTTWLLPALSMNSHIFLGAILCATSVGITARVFQDLGWLDTQLARIVLGAAVIDDVLGLLILAVVSGVVQSGSFDGAVVVSLLFRSLVFLAVIIFLGPRIIQFSVRIARRFESVESHLHVLVPLILVLFVAWLASYIGLAAIVGAFAAGLVLSDDQFSSSSEPSSVKLRELVHPFEVALSPCFFILMGMQVDLRTFVQEGVIITALALTAVAIVGKLIAGLPAGRGVNKLAVGIAMVPRGEVGLIFASMGKGLGVISEGLFSAVVVMVMVTTILTPLGLAWALGKARGEGGGLTA